MVEFDCGGAKEKWENTFARRLYRKLNVVTITDVFPLPFMDSVLDMYSFLDGFSGYNQV